MIGHPAVGFVWDRLSQPGGDARVPHLADIEVAQVLRLYVLRGAMAAPRAEEALDVYQKVPIVRYPHAVLLPRIWQLRASISAHDAAYVALAEALFAPLLTRDGRLARSQGHWAIIELV